MSRHVADAYSRVRSKVGPHPKMLQFAAMIEAEIAGHSLAVRREGQRVWLNEQPVQVVLNQASAVYLHFSINGKAFEALLHGYDAEERLLHLRINGKAVAIKVTTQADSLAELIGVDLHALPPAHDLKAPMPGLVRAIKVKPGDAVEPDQPLLVLEAMKMENILKSPGAGVVKEVLAQPDAAVEKGAVLITFEPAEA